MRRVTSLLKCGEVHANFSFKSMMATATGGDGSNTKYNRLFTEKSPYLLQHAANPVDWYPWGEEAFQAAKSENKLIFLSVGYSTCHWCHVMERESFESEETAKILNENFISVKVDREERPDIDKVYMTFVTSLTRRGGWPMSVWLTPDLKPVYGGTYFPPETKFGQPGFPTILHTLAKQWIENKAKCQASGDDIIEELKRMSRITGNMCEVPKDEVIAKCFSQFQSSYEPEFGGFSGAPKFPQPANHNFLMTYYFLNPELEDAQQAKEMVLYTLSMMDRGGIHDHVAQGFARYSTDERWHVPHFEKMLYDQAQLVMSYLDAYLASGKERYKDVVEDIITYVTRDLSHPCGGFYSAEDADSLPTADGKEKKEGAFCVWKYDEIRQLLHSNINDSSDVRLCDLFCHHYSVAETGNVDGFKDPHGELKDQNVLIEHGDVEETAAEFGISESECEDALRRCRSLLYEFRKTRPRPHLDDKMVTAWNGMMFGSIARAGAVLGNESYINRAVKTATFIKTYLWKNEKLHRAAYCGEDNLVSLGSSIKGFADDYAWTIRGLVHLYEATLDQNWLEWAEELQDLQNELFWDDTSAGYFMTETGDDSVLIRLKEDQDGAEPSVNSVSAGNLIRLGALLDKDDYKNKSKEIFKLFSNYLQRVPIAVPEMATALQLFDVPPTQIIISGSKKNDEFGEMLKVVHNSILPSRVLLVADEDQQSFLYKSHPNLNHYVPKDSSKVFAFVCQNFVCSLPMRSADLLKDKLSTPLALSN